MDKVTTTSRKKKGRSILDQRRSRRHHHAPLRTSFERRQSDKPPENPKRFGSRSVPRDIAKSHFGPLRTEDHQTKHSRVPKVFWIVVGALDNSKHHFGSLPTTCHQKITTKYPKHLAPISVPLDIAKFRFRLLLTEGRQTTLHHVHSDVAQDQQSLQLLILLFFRRSDYLISVWHRSIALST